ncbi:MAG: AMP-binding protein [Ramlibacter sp.]|nr:AMP-binding protein [Ramlibacter sp.]
MPQGLNRVMNLGNLLAQTAAKYPSLPGLIQAERCYSWSSINARVDALANHLRARGVGPGDRILAQLPNGLPLFESAFASFKLGAVWVPVNFRLSPPEIASIAVSCGAALMLTQSQFDEHAACVQGAVAGVQLLRADGEVYETIANERLAQPFAAAQVSYSHPLWFFFTSGTTGKPKAAVLTHGQMAFVITNHLADLLPGLTQQDRSLVLAPLSHGAGIHALVNVARGAASVLLAGDSLDCEAAYAAIQRHRVSNLFSVPTILKRLAEDPAADRYDHTSLKHVIYAGAPMHRADQERALAKLGAVLVQYFGLGEVTGSITVLRADEHLEGSGALLDTCGTARTGLEVAVLDEQCRPVATGVQGEICTRGPAVFAGYWDNPEANEKAFRGGWFHTGDLGTMDDRGFVRITGRSSDMYISGGSNVYPREIEEVLLTLDGVGEAAVFGIPHETWGEIGVALLVPSFEGAQLSEQVVLEHLAGRLAKYKWPRIIQVWGSLPKSAYGKIAKKDLRAEYLLRMRSADGVAA